ncbi:hypothetical protein GALMADRAFT_831008 [Galerina marginata CBS 339.88]|uniref:Uncharacterized protein n=1 Tax=Galerina marginata (strain CBS 339.88) TaxID=685588 RepID=A0A067TJQ7_GALM3|nr:hypothetical protein GALMADRAFT_831008 [Galerina marginata CBS 339.88]
MTDAAAFSPSSFCNSILARRYPLSPLVSSTNCKTNIIAIIIITAVPCSNLFRLLPPLYTNVILSRRRIKVQHALPTLLLIPSSFPSPTHTPTHPYFVHAHRPHLFFLIMAINHRSYLAIRQNGLACHYHPIP